MTKLVFALIILAACALATQACAWTHGVASGGTPSHVTAESSNRITTEGGDELITES